MSHNKGATAKVEQQALNYSRASTSYDASVAQAGREEDQYSLYTYDSNMDAQSFRRQIGDRAYNVLSDVYYLPADDDEWARLNKQHIALLLALGGLYAEPDAVRALLAPQQGVVKRILDLGCGTGVWASDMGKEFPHCEVVGVDLAPVPENGSPANVRYEIDDVNIGLSHFHDQFDVVHARLIGTGLRDFRATMEDVEKCLKPGSGGIVLWFDVDFDMYAKDQHVYMPFGTEENPTGSWLQRIGYEARRCAVASGRSDIYGMSDALDAGLWDRPLLDPETCKAASLYLPIGPWLEETAGSEKQVTNFVGALMRQDLMSAHRASHAVIKRAGFSEELLQEWSKNADEQMMSMSQPMWMRMRLAWGRRRASENSSAAPLPALSAELTGNSPPSPPKPKYPHYHIYETPEEALHEKELRDRHKDLPVPPLPTTRD